MKTILSLATALTAAPTALADASRTFSCPITGWMGGPGMMGYGGWFGPILMLIFWALVIAGIILLIRWMAGMGKRPASGDHPAAGAQEALDILNRRYAAGEIDQEEYITKKKDLE